MEPWQLLAQYVNYKKGPTESAEDLDVFVQSCWAEAQILVDAFIGTRPVPDVIYTRAVIETGAALFRRKKQYDQAAGLAGGVVGLMPANDPMSAVYAMLRPWVGWF
jgi:hypothetical protein